MNKKYIIRLSDEERQTCRDVVKRLKGTSQKVRRAQMLLKADADGPAWTDSRIAEAFNCRVQTIENLRKRLVTEGFDLALNGKKRKEPPTPPKLDGEGEANNRETGQRQGQRQASRGGMANGAGAPDGTSGSGGGTGPAYVRGLGLQGDDD